MVIIGVITIVYTFYGGITAVVWNDVIQLVVYIAGAVIAFFLLIDHLAGGWQEITRLAAESDKFQIFDFSFSLENPYTFVGAIVGGAFLAFATHGTDQMMVQRYLSCSSRAKSQQGLILERHHRAGTVLALPGDWSSAIQLLRAFFQRPPGGQPANLPGFHC